MKGKITMLLLSFVVVLSLGIGVAYYNTRLYGFDDEVKIVSLDDDKISVLDYDIYYNDINNILNKAKSIMPRQYNTCKTTI